MTQVKICGLMTPADVAIVNEAQPDYAGFILAGGRHHVSLKTVRTLLSQLAPGIKPVGVFVNAPLAEMLAALAAGITTIQLHGDEPESVVQLLQNHGATVIRVFRHPAGELPFTHADAVMVDAGAGSGQTLAWSSLTPVVTHPYFLAGGLTPENVSAAIAAVRPDVVDVSSGVELDQHKDAAKVAAFVTTAHAVSEKGLAR